MAIAEDRVGRYSPWRDAGRLISLIAELKAEVPDETPEANRFIEAFEQGLIRLLDGHVQFDDLDNIVEDIDENAEYLSDAVKAAADQAMAYQINHVETFLEDADSESTLSDHIKALRKFGPRIRAPEAVVERAVSRVEERIGEIEERRASPSSLSISESTGREVDNFDNAELANLFAPLVHGFR